MRGVRGGAKLLQVTEHLEPATFDLRLESRQLRDAVGVSCAMCQLDLGPEGAGGPPSAMPSPRTTPRWVTYDRQVTGRVIGRVVDLEPPVLDACGLAGAGAGHAGHDARAAPFRNRFWVTLVLSIPVVVCAPMIQEWFGYTAPRLPGLGIRVIALGRSRARDRALITP